MPAGRTGKMPALRPAHVGTGPRIDLNGFAFLDEQRDIDAFAGLQFCWFCDVASSIAAHAFGRFDNLQTHRGGQLQLDWSAFCVKDLNRKIFHQIVFGVCDQVFLVCDRVVRLRIHEVVSVAITVTEVELFSLDLDQFHLIGGTEADVSTFARVDVANDRLDECAQIPRRTMVHFQDNRGIAIVFYGHSFAKIVGGSHGSVKSLKRSADVTRAGQFCNVGQAHRLPSGRQPTPLRYNSFSRVKSCESTMPTGTLLSSITTRSSMRWCSSRLSTSTASLSLCTVTGFNVIKSATRRSPILGSD